MHEFDDIPPPDDWGDYVPNDRSIRFTQYMLPNGRKETHYIERDGEILAKARKLEAAGFVFECEMLRDYSTISFEVLHDEDGDRSLAHKLVKNGPDVPATVDQMIVEACAALEAGR